MIPTHPRLPHLALCLQAAEVVLGQPNRGAAAILSALIGASTSEADVWDLDRARTAMALLVGACARPDSAGNPALRTTLDLLRIVLSLGADGPARCRHLIARCTFGEAVSVDPYAPAPVEAIPLLDWLVGAPPIPAKTLRRRAKLAARANAHPSLETSR